MYYLLAGEGALLVLAVAGRQQILHK
jgi:hypothetical protein